jgi:uncharacterized membrane protein YfcA
MDLSQALVLGLIGLIAGLLGGMLGIGGAIVIIPVLVIFLGYTQQTAQGTTLLMLSLPVGALAAWQYYQNGYVDVRAALILAAFFFVGGLFGSKIALRIPQEVLKKSFGLLLLGLALKMLFFDRNPEPETKKTLPRHFPRAISGKVE